MNRWPVSLFILLISLTYHAQAQSRGNPFAGMNPGKYYSRGYRAPVTPDNLDDEIAKTKRNFQANQAHLKHVGFQGQGFYPFCSDVIHLYELQEAEILNKKNEAAGKNATPAEFKIDWEKIEAEQLKKQSLDTIGVELEVIQFADRNRSNVDVCFGGSTLVTMLMKNLDPEISNLTSTHTSANSTTFNDVFKVPTIYAGDLRKVPYMWNEIPMEKLSTMFMESHAPYVMSSTLEVIPDESFHLDCWADILKLQRGQLDEEQDFNHIAVQAPKGYMLHATPDHRFYMCKDGKCAWERADHLRKDMNFYAGKDQRYPMAGMSMYAVGDGEFGIDRYRQVYNLTTNTYVYYVGHTNGRVLVHNVR